MPDYEPYLSGLVREVVGIDYVVTTLCIRSATAWGASSLEYPLLPYNLVLHNLRLAYQVTKISVSSIANDGFICKLLTLGWVYLEMAPGFFQDPPQVR